MPKSIEKKNVINLRENNMPAVLEKSLKITDIKKKAKGLGIKPGKMKKTELIHAIQRAEGNTTCFGMAVDYCSNSDCCFIKDCFKTQL